MKATLYFVLIVGLVGAAVPVTAQGQGPLALAFTREANAVRLASAQSGGTTDESSWSHVRALQARTDVVVTIRGSKPETRQIVEADDSTLTLSDTKSRWFPGSRARRNQDPVVESIAREDVLEIRFSGSVSKKRRAGGILAAIAGAYAGGAAGFLVALATVPDDAPVLDPSPLGGVAIVGGAVAGGWLAYRAVMPSTQGDLIYRAP